MQRDDRELDDYLRGGSRLSAAYRESGGEEPSADLDEVLLERSRRELRLGPKVAWSPFTRAWSVPLALAAMLVVSVSVTLVMHQESGEPLPVPAQPAADRAPQPPAREEATPVPAAKPAPAARPAPPASAPGPAPAVPLGKRIQVEPQRDLAPGVAQVREAAPAASESAPAVSSEARDMAPAMRAAPGLEEKLAAPRAKQEAASDADLGPDPEVWVRRIEALRREGRSAEAEALLMEFRRRFPDYPADRLPK